MKRLYLLSTLMLVMAVAMLPQKSFAQTFYQVCNTGQWLGYSVTNSTEVSVGSSSCLMFGDLNIPSSVSYNGNTYSVTSIGNYAFSGCSGLASITIPSSVTTIGWSAFSGCSGLTSITIPNTVTTIGSYAFDGCSGLTSITIPSSVTSIGSYAFDDCSGLTEIIVDANNSVYDSRENCNAIIHTNSNTLITGCQNTVIPSSVTSIGNYAFSGCSGLASITIPSSVTSIEDYAFSGCSGLASITIPSSVTSIGNSAFSGCSSLTSITIPSSVTSIGTYAFNDCSSLTSITISNSVTSIGGYAFWNCSSLTSITIPSSITSIEVCAFQGCSSLTEIIVDANNSVYDSRENCNAIIRTDDNTLIVGCQNTVIPSSVTTIGWYAFNDCSSLTSITIPSSVSSIGSYAFDGCSGLTEIIVDANNSVYDSRENCNAIIRTNDNTLIAGCQNTVIPSSVTSIGTYAFNDCSSLASITIPSSVTSIGSYAFRGCSSLASITIPSSVTSIGSLAFSGCSGLASITIPSSVTSIGGYAFWNCSSLTSITIPSSVTSIDGAFYGCSSLTSITIPSSVTSIGPYTFCGCGSLTSITIPSSVSSIGSYAFDGCSSLTTITIPSSVTSIGPHTFCGCGSLTSITIPSSVTTIGQYAFNVCSSLTSITIPSSVTSIEEYAFRGCSGLTEIIVDASNSVYDSRDNCNAVIRTNDNALVVGCQNTIIPASVTSIEEGSFFNCFDTNSLTSLAIVPPELNGCVCDIFGDLSDDFQVFIPCGTLADYIQTWGNIHFNEHGSDISITIVTSDTCFTWNDETFCNSGDYTQIFTDVHGCDSVVTLHLTITVGIDDHNLAASMTVYPNPTTGIVNVQCSMNNVQVGTMEILVYDAFGRLLRSTDGVETQNFASLQTDTHGSSVQTQIDLSRYAPGVYLIKAVADGNVVAVRKVVRN